MEKRYWYCCVPEYPLTAKYAFKAKPGVNRDYVMSDDDLLQVNGEFVQDHSTGCCNLPNHTI